MYIYIPFFHTFLYICSYIFYNNWIFGLKQFVFNSIFLCILLLNLDKVGILTLNETHLQGYYKVDIFFQILVYYEVLSIVQFLLLIYDLKFLIMLIH